MNQPDAIARRILAGGIISLAVALGISRFAYTPLLPLMQQEVAFGDDFAGLLASVNYVGYLAGALWAAWTAQSGERADRLRLHLALTILSILGMGLTQDPLVWFALRFVSGTSSALVFVLASGLVLEALARYGRPAWSGWLYAGVGLGIAVSVLLIVPLNAWAGWRGGWIGLAAVSALLAWGIRGWVVEPESSTVSTGQNSPGRAEPISRGLLPWLVAAYGLEGLGYIVTGTFLVAWLQRSSELGQAGFLAWFLVGVAAIPSCILWMKAGLRLGLVPTLILAHLVQALGILLPLLSPTLWGALGGAVFFGGTFLGIAALTLVLGRGLAPQNPSRVIAILTAAFGAGQMLGPVIAGYLATQTLGTSLPLIGAAAVVAGGAVLLGIGLACTQGARLMTAQPTTDR